MYNNKRDIILIKFHCKTKKPWQQFMIHKYVIASLEVHIESIGLKFDVFKKKKKTLMGVYMSTLAFLPRTTIRKYKN